MVAFDRVSTLVPVACAENSVGAATSCGGADSREGVVDDGTGWVAAARARTAGPVAAEMAAIGVEVFNDGSNVGGAAAGAERGSVAASSAARWAADPPSATCADVGVASANAGAEAESGDIVADKLARATEISSAVAAFADEGASVSV